MMENAARRSRPRWDLRDDDEPARGGRGMYVGMLLEDLSNRHYSYRWQLNVEADEQRRAEEFTSSFLSDTGHHRGARLEHQFWDFMELVTYEIVMHGRCVAEMYTAGPEVETRPFRAPRPGPRIDVLPGWSLKFSRSRVWQTDATQKRGLRSLSDASLLDFQPDPRLAQGLVGARRSLEKLDTSPLDRRIDMATSGAPGYDLALHQRYIAEVAAKATASIGWSGRGLITDRATDSYRLYRNLRFVKTWLGLVRLTETTLTKALQLTGDQAAPRSVSISGLPTISEVEQGMRLVQSGEESLDSIRHRLVSPRYAPQSE